MIKDLCFEIIYILYKMLKHIDLNTKFYPELV